MRKKQISKKYHITYFRANDFCKLWFRIYHKHNKKPRNDLEVFYKWEIFKKMEGKWNTFLFIL